MINKIGGNFTADDEQALTELAAHAAIALENTQQWEQLLAARKQIADQAAQGVQLIGAVPGRSRPSARRSAASPIPSWPC